MQFSKSWTLITLSAVCAVAIGCGRANLVVWVDLDRAAKAHGFVLTSQSPTTATGHAPSANYAVPALPPSSRGRTAAAEKRQEALLLMRQQLDEAFDSLLRAYRRELLGKAAVTESALKALLIEHRSNLAESVLNEAAGVVNAGVSERADTIVRLALLAGWPDRGGSAFVPIARTGKVEAEWKKETDDLRQKLLAYDAKIEDRIAAILAKQKELDASESAIIAARIKDTFDRAEEDALRKAVQRVRATGRLDPPQLLTNQRVALPGQPAKSVTAPAVSAGRPEATKIDAAVISRRALTAKLNIWLRIRGYKLAPGPQGVPDKPGEFIAWSKP